MARKYYKKSRKSFKRKSYRKKRFFRKPKMSIQRGNTFGNQQLVRIRFVETRELAPTTSNRAVAIYRCNSAFDPAFTTNSNPSPKGHLFWKQLYNEYVVLGSKIKVEAMPFAPGSTNAAATGYITINQEDSTLLPTNQTSYVDAIQGPRVRYKMLQQSGQRQPAVRHTYSPKKFFGIRDTRDSHNLRSAVDENPDEIAYWHVHFYTLDPSAATTVGPRVTVIIDMLVLYTGPKYLNMQLNTIQDVTGLDDNDAVSGGNQPEGTS